MNKNDGLLDLTALESANQDDVLDLNINESADVSVPVPGGLNEKAPGQPADQTIPVPSKTTITADTYNVAISNLKKTFKEAAEFMEILENATIVQKTADQMQEEYTEDAIAEAVFSSYADGPIYEAVDKANKAEIKGIAKKIRKELCKIKRTINWYTGKKSSGAKLGLLDPVVISSRNRKLELKAWQLVCLVYPQKRVSLGKVLDDLNEEFSEILGDYKLKFIKMNTYNLTAKAKDLTEDDKNKTRSIFKMYILVVDDNSEKEAALDVELDESNMEKLRNAIGGTAKNINEFVDFMIDESKECDDGCCDEDCDSDKSEKNEKKDD